MRRTSLVAALCAVLIALAFTAAGWARQRVWHVAAQSGFEAKVEYCKTCHGLSGEGYRGYYPIPRLAGQQPKYIENQLRAFLERRRKSPLGAAREAGAEGVMLNVAHGLSPAQFGALAAHFRSLDPAPLGGAPTEQMSLGKRIYENGLPETNVPACMACHGPDGKGGAEIPRLAGQLYPYTLHELAYWTRERGQNGAKDDVSAIMIPTVQNLTPAQASAVAAYVSSLR
ncbi:c-type cytochrome [Methylocystis bryophila]|uniref:Cytochrome C n=1 Tax=Methylocystis bryophila TaxID=655015 RepID=A0A1W6N1G3_9HYPH|nr:c-type cytochrome [Methylocystis bryophila]ARN83591.1 cytochrome C [Methylocystis bryophila]